MRHVSAGDEVRFSADRENKLSRMLDRWRPAVAAGPTDFDYSQTQCYITNDTEHDVQRGAVLAIRRRVFGFPIPEPDEYGVTAPMRCTPEFVFGGGAPEEGAANRFGVTLEPIRAGRSGRGCMWGLCPALIIISDLQHQYADVNVKESPDDDDLTFEEMTTLKTAPFGGVEILTPWGNAEEEDDRVLAWVRVGFSAPPVIYGVLGDDLKSGIDPETEEPYTVNGTLSYGGTGKLRCDNIPGASYIPQGAMAMLWWNRLDRCFYVINPNSCLIKLPS